MPRVSQIITSKFYAPRHSLQHTSCFLTKPCNARHSAAGRIIASVLRVLAWGASEGCVRWKAEMCSLEGPGSTEHVVVYLDDLLVLLRRSQRLHEGSIR
jgi:hypothetical protein